MKMLALSMILALAAGLGLTPSAHAQTTPNYVFTCMAGISGFGSSGGAACTSATNYFFETLVVWDEEGFDAPATAALRTMYMSLELGTSVSTNRAIANEIVNVWYGTP